MGRGINFCMPEIIKKCFLYHYDSSINSDKVFNLFLIDNLDGTYSALQEYGRRGTKLCIKTLAERYSLPLAQHCYYEKRSAKINHRMTPYLETFSCSSSPTLQKYGAGGGETGVQPGENIAFKGGKVINFKSGTQPQAQETTSAQAEKQSGEQNTGREEKKRSKQIGVLNLGQLDALEF